MPRETGASSVCRDGQIHLKRFNHLKGTRVKKKTDGASYLCPVCRSRARIRVRHGEWRWVDHHEPDGRKCLNSGNKL